MNVLFIINEIKHHVRLGTKFQGFIQKFLKWELLTKSRACTLLISYIN